MFTTLRQDNANQTKPNYLLKQIHISVRSIRNQIKFVDGLILGINLLIFYMAGFFFFFLVTRRNLRTNLSLFKENSHNMRIIPTENCCIQFKRKKKLKLKTSVTEQCGCDAGCNSWCFFFFL